MPKKDDDFSISETGNWNVASDFARLKIMKNLYLADEYSNIAMFGEASLLDELEATHDLEYLKIKGFERLITTLILIIDNTLFALKKGDLENVKKHRENLKIIKAATPHFWKVVSKTNKSRTFKIDYKEYNKALEKVQEIKSELNKPLNAADLIFTNKQEFDPQAYKKNVFLDATTRG